MSGQRDSSRGWRRLLTALVRGRTVPTTMLDSALEDISKTIQLAVAPVFLLSAIGTTLSVLTTRLSRVIDRARTLEARFATSNEAEQSRSRVELDLLSRRARLIYVSLTTGVGAALSVCLLIMVAFIGYLFQVNVGRVVALLFIVALGLFVFALINFLREIFRSLESLRFGLRSVVPEQKA